MNGRSTSGTTGLGTVEVSGRRRVPSPPTRITRLHASAAARSPLVDRPAPRQQPAPRTARRPARCDRRSRACRASPRRPRPVELEELGPLGDEHDRVGIVRAHPSRNRRSEPADQLARLLLGDRIIRADHRASACSRAASTSEEAPRMSSVFGLNASPSSATRLPTRPPRCLLQLGDHAALLQLVDLDHGVQQLEVVAGVAGQLLQRARRPWGSSCRRSRSRPAGTSARCARPGPCRARPRPRRRRSPRRRWRSR